MVTAKTKQKILQTFLDLLCAHPYEDVSLPMIAEAAKVKLSDMRAAYGSRRDLVAAFAETVDTEVLDARDEDMADQPPRDRLFDVLMTRIDALSKNREAVRTLYAAARRDPALALEFNQIEVKSQRWMLIAAGIEASGFKAGMISQGLAVAFARVVDVWLGEEDEGMPRTMAALDKELDRGSSFMQRLNGLERAAKGFRSFLNRASERRRGRRARDRDDVDEADVTGDAPAGA